MDAVALSSVSGIDSACSEKTRTYNDGSFCKTFCKCEPRKKTFYGYVKTDPATNNNTSINDFLHI